jgi:CMP-N,N'-diacetyllegionaminic acid synthase
VSTLAIIPARAGSKGLPGKNWMPICGKPLVSWTIEQAKTTESISKIVVSSDAWQVLDIATRMGVSSWTRPAELAEDDTSTEAVIEHVLDKAEKQGEKFDNVVLLQPTSPIRTAAAINEAVSRLDDHDCVVSVTQSDRFMWFINPDGGITPSYDTVSRPRRQDAAPYFLENGSIYAFTVKGFREYGTRIFGNQGMLLMPDMAAYEIDNYTDWLIVEAIMQKEMEQVNV